MKKAMPLILTIVGFFGIGSLAVYRIYSYDSYLVKGTAILTVCVYICWMVWESRISRNELKKASENFDAGTMELAALAKYILLSTSFIFQPQFNVTLAIIGFVLLVSGILIRTSGIRKLGIYYSHRIRKIEDAVVSDGVYGIIRHPAYMGTLVLHYGFVLIFCNYISLASLVFWTFVVWLRCYKENKVLMQSKEYQEYAHKVRWNLIPGVW